jgi:RNA polymerase subunit RPABC4/transcription elongation factor Spt4
MTKTTRGLVEAAARAASRVAQETGRVVVALKDAYRIAYEMVQAGHVSANDHAMRVGRTPHSYFADEIDAALASSSVDAANKSRSAAQSLQGSVTQMYNALSVAMRASEVSAKAAGLASQCLASEESDLDAKVAAGSLASADAARDVVNSARLACEYLRAAVQIAHHVTDNANDPVIVYSQRIAQQTAIIEQLAGGTERTVKEVYDAASQVTELATRSAEKVVTVQAGPVHNVQNIQIQDSVIQKSQFGDLDKRNDAVLARYRESVRKTVFNDGKITDRERGFLDMFIEAEGLDRAQTAEIERQVQAEYESTKSTAAAPVGSATGKSACPNCRIETQPKWKACPECGSPLPKPAPAPPTSCPKCSEQVKPTWKMCPSCGTALTV